MMLSRAIKRTVLDIRWSPFIPSISYHSRLFNSTPPIVQDTQIRQTIETQVEKHELPSMSVTKGSFTSHGYGLVSPIPENQQSSDGLLDGSIRTLLPLLRAQGPHYITAHIYARPYLLTAGDTLRLPFHMPGVIPGDVLRLNRASNIGSRDLTLKGMPYIDERLFECRARVIGVEAEPMRIKEKTKRRQRTVKTARSKHRFTVLKISELKINLLDDIEA